MAEKEKMVLVRAHAIGHYVHIRNPGDEFYIAERLYSPVWMSRLGETREPERGEPEAQETPEPEEPQMEEEEEPAPPPPIHKGKKGSKKF